MEFLTLTAATIDCNKDCKIAYSVKIISIILLEDFKKAPFSTSHDASFWPVVVA